MSEFPTYTVTPEASELAVYAGFIDSAASVALLTEKETAIISRAWRASVSVVQEYWEHRTATPEAAQAILLIGNRLIKRQLSPDGISQWSIEAGGTYVARTDPDVIALLGPPARKLAYR